MVCLSPNITTLLIMFNKQCMSKMLENNNSVEPTVKVPGSLAL